jgi:hypothetical protein
MRGIHLGSTGSPFFNLANPVNKGSDFSSGMLGLCLRKINGGGEQLALATIDREDPQGIVGMTSVSMMVEISVQLN